jgi:hypothetical protein
MSAANGEQESEESYACRYENLGREPWEGEEDDADDDGYDAFENYFDQKPGNYIHDMIDRIDDLKEAVRKAATDVRERQYHCETDERRARARSYDCEPGRLDS